MPIKEGYDEDNDNFLFSNKNTIEENIKGIEEGNKRLQNIALKFSVYPSKGDNNENEKIKLIRPILHSKTIKDDGSTKTRNSLKSNKRTYEVLLIRNSQDQINIENNINNNIIKKIIWIMKMKIQILIYLKKRKINQE